MHNKQKSAPSDKKGRANQSGGRRGEKFDEEAGSTIKKGGTFDKGLKTNRKTGGGEFGGAETRIRLNPKKTNRAKRNKYDWNKQKWPQEQLEQDKIMRF